MRRLTMLSIIYLVATPVGAQTSSARNRGSSRSLTAIDSLVSRSHFREAASALDQWEREHTSSITPAQRATALLLRGRMTLSADSARPYYLQLAIGYPSSPEAAAAFMRLGQMAVADNDIDRATSYFHRVVTDYPLSPLHDDAVNALAAVTPRKAGTVATGSTSSNTAPRADEAKNRAFALQVGAYRDFSTAQGIERKLDKLGFDARVVTITGSSLARIRVGKFATTHAADDLMRRLRAAGYDAVVVDDARSESLRSK